MSASPTTDTIHVLERLLVTCHDGIDGYRRAAEDVGDAPVRSFLAQAASEREEVASVLTNTLVTLGHKPAHDGSISGAVHRRWLDTIATVGQSTPKVILRECQRGEHETLAAFTAVMGRAMPDDVRELVQTLFKRLLQASAALNEIVDGLEAQSGDVLSGGEHHVADIMNSKLLYVSEGDRLTLTRAKILEFGVTAIPILDDEHRPAGVVSLRDLNDGDEPHASSPARVVRGDATIEEGARTLATSGVHHLVVVDEAGVALGMVSAVDFVRALTGLPVQHPRAFTDF